MNATSQHEQNRQIVARYWQEFWTNGNTSVVDELCAEDVTVFYPLHGQFVGKPAVKKMLEDFKKVCMS